MRMILFIDMDLNSLLMYFIYFCVTLAMWHYAVPKPVKKEAKRIVGDFLRYLVYGNKKSKSKKLKVVTGGKMDEKDKRIKSLELEVKQLRKEKEAGGTFNQNIGIVKSGERGKGMSEYHMKKDVVDVNKEISEHQKKTKEIMKDLW